jgi:hypothetical protein
MKDLGNALRFKKGYGRILIRTNKPHDKEEGVVLCGIQLAPPKRNQQHYLSAPSQFP